MVSSLMNFNGNGIFSDNYAAVAGGGILSVQSTLNFSGSINFTHNSAAAGGGISEVHSTMKVTGNWIFTNNSANSEGGGIHILYSSLKHFGNSTFRNHSAKIGGGIYAKGSTLSTTGNSSDKIGEHSGGVSLCTSLYLKNLAMTHGGAVYAEDSVLSFQGCNTFCGNSAQYYAGGVYSKNNTLKLNG